MSNNLKLVKYGSFKGEVTIPQSGAVATDGTVHKRRLYTGVN